MSKISVDEIFYEDFVYPRSKHSDITVDSYTESLLSGAEFPAIELQRVQYDGEVKNVLVDGWHRWQAHIKASKQGDLFVDADNFKQIEFQYWQLDKILPRNDTLEMLRMKLRAAAVNSQHGDRLKITEKESVAREIAENSPKEEITQKEVAAGLGVRQQQISEWVADIRARQTAGRDCLIKKLSLLGWTQAEIGEKVGISRNRVSEIVGNTDFGKTDTELQTFLSQGRQMDWITEHYSIDMPLAWALRLYGMPDLERFKELEIPLKLYDDWSFQGCDVRMGISYPGRIPGQLVMNALYYYTEPGDLVIDPMAGGGSVVDACLLMNRKCYAYDLVPSREDIQEHDIESSLPPASDKCALMFIDPPYWSMLDEQYSDEAVSSKTLPEFNEWLGKLASDCYTTLKPGAKLAFLIQNQTEKDIPEGEYYLDHVFTAYKGFVDAGFKMMRRINCPLNTETFTPQQVDASKEAKHLMGLVRDLLVMIKE